MPKLLQAGGEGVSWGNGGSCGLGRTRTSVAGIYKRDEFMDDGKVTKMSFLEVFAPENRRMKISGR
jgi:hypothetical protein